MQNFKSFLAEEREFRINESLELINEKLIIFRGKRPKGGRVIFLAGGAGSGKGFAMSNFLDISRGTDKIRDVDAWKEAYLELDKIQKKFPEIRGLNLKNPSDVGKLHKFVAGKKIKNKTLDLLLTDLSGRNLPNIVFDVTLKDKSDIEKVIPRLIKSGYDPKDIHLVWVLTGFDVAVTNNKSRDRVVPDDILLKTHEGAAQTMFKILQGSLPRGLDGEIHVINNNRENTVTLVNDITGNAVIKDFLSIKVKDAGKKLNNEKQVKNKVLQWMADNIPKSKNLPEIFKELKRQKIPVK